MFAAGPDRSRQRDCEPRRSPLSRMSTSQFAGLRYTSRMKTTSFLAAGAAVATLAAPSTAFAAPGWELPQTSSFVEGNRELPNTTYATHCGSSQYGVYRFRIGVTARGVWGGVRFRVQLTADGAGHAATRVRFVGSMSKPLE